MKSAKAVEIIEINPSELYTNSGKILWLNDNSEIKFCNNIYDVVGVKNDGKKVLLYVFNDEKEKSLLNEFEKLDMDLNDESESSENTTDFLEDIVDLEFINDISGLIPNSNEGVVKYSNKEFNLSQGFSTIFIPPPNN